ncbi:MAG: hypothetical protein CVU44_08460 [Chloroflexi bacterium HGW-Chloroflexi-6]|nr:MAG: hypothetical protein CVU44_08460 [Chloroflexi bacterium HGW-Chloroflexi-6]
MPVENLLQEVNIVATLAGILAGFAFSAVVQFIASNQPGRLTTIIISIFSLSALMFLYTLFAFVLIGMSTAELNQEIKALDGMGNWAFIIAFLGLIFFLTGVGLTGWVRSTATGIATSLFALMTLCLSLWAFFTAASAFS